MTDYLNVKAFMVVLFLLGTHQLSCYFCMRYDSKTINIGHNDG